MSKKKYLIISVLFIFLVIISTFTVSFATGTNTTSSNFDFTAFDGGGNSSVNTAAETVLGTGVSVIRIVATGISIIMLSYIGIKYMMAAPAERADFKKSIPIYVLGAVLVFGAGNILTVIANYNIF